MQQPFLRKTSIALLVMWLPLLSLAKIPGTDIKKSQQAQQTPIAFIENKGQITDQDRMPRKDIDVKLEIPGMTVFIGKGQLHYQWSKDNVTKENATMRQYGNAAMNNALNKTSLLEGRQNINDQSLPGSPNKKDQSLPGIRPTNKISNNGRGVISTYRMDVTLVGANKHARAVAEDKLDYYETYYLPQCPDGAVAHTYKKITYKDIYPHIDWVLYVKSKVESENLKISTSGAGDESRQGGVLKYDFVVHEGGNVNDIKLRYDGATALGVKDGALVAVTPFGSITEEAPYSYDAMTKEKISSSFVLQGNTISFDIANTERHNIVIDPSLRWATYYGGNNGASGIDVTVDNIGMAYLMGNTQSTLNMATTGAYQASYVDSGDAYVVKFDTNGNRIWATYYGGTGQETARAIKTDAAGNIYIAGSTTSPSGVTSTGAYQTVYGWTSVSTTWGDGLLVKLDSSGSRIWATYYGGNDGDLISAVATDPSGNVYIGGWSISTNAIATSGAFQTAYGEGFFAKFNSSGVRQWGSYLNAKPLAMACSPSGGYLYITGWTDSATGVSTTGCYQFTRSGTGVNGFLEKFNNAGQRVWGTFYNGNIRGTFNGIAIDNGENIYVGGGTYSTTGVTSTGAYKTTVSGSADALLVKFNSLGQRQWATYYGGIGPIYEEEIEHIVAMPNGDVYVSGYTTSSSGISTGGAYQSSYGGNEDAFLAKFSKDGQLAYGTYYGGAGIEYIGPAIGPSIAYGNRRMYLAGGTASTANIATPGAFQSALTGGSDAFLAQFLLTDTNVYMMAPFTDTAICVGDTLHVRYGVTYPFRSNNVFTIQLSDGSGSFSSLATIGTKAGTGADSIKWEIPTSIVSGVNYTLRIISTAPADTSYFANIKLSQYPTGLSISSNTPLCESDSLKLNANTTTAGVMYTWTGPLAFTSPTKDTFIATAPTTASGYYVMRANFNNCIIKDSVNVLVKPMPAKPNAGIDKNACPGTTLNLSAATITPSVTWGWKGPGGYSAATQNPTKGNITAGDAGNYIVTDTLNGCIAKDTIAITTNITTATPTAGSNTPVCVGGVINLTASSVPGASYSWTGPVSFSAFAQNPSRNNATLAFGGAYSVTANINGCVSLPSTTTVTVITGPSVAVYASPGSTICTGGNVALVSIPTNVGPGATYDWYKNGISTGVTTNSLIPTTVSNGDIFYVLLTAASACNTPVSSNQVIITVLPNTPPPTASITANPATNIWPGLFVGFSSSITNGGTTPTYQWKRNGKNVVGATNATWGATDLNNNDTICLSVTSSDICATPKSVLSNCIEMSIATGVSLTPPGGDFSVYPNPNRGEFTFSFGSQPLNPLAGDLYVYTLQGQEVAHYVISAAKTVIQLPKGLSAGVYMGRYVSGDGASSVLRIVVNE